MRIRLGLLALTLWTTMTPSLASGILLTHATIYDGGGGKPFIGDVRIRGERIVEVAEHLAAQAGERVIDEQGLALAPGFIDMHSHGDRGLLQDPDAGPIARQGVTTIFVGQDGESHFPLAEYFGRLAVAPPAINVASLVGHASVRAAVMGKDLFRPATSAEVARMQEVLTRELDAGAFGLSTGLEYEAAHFSTTEEVVALARVAAAHGGYYISHVRDEANGVFPAFDELVRIGREAKLPVEITHIKLGSVRNWHQAALRMPAYFEAARREHIDLRADVYPYTYWHSTIRVLVPDRDFFNRRKVAAAITDNGGAGAIRVAHYTPEPAMGGHSLAEIADAWHVTPVDAFMRIVRATMAEVNSDVEMEDIIVTSMSEDDVRWFIAQPNITFCSDGELHGAHPRGAGTFPRILGRYARDEHVLPLELAIYKMTGLPAAETGLTDRGRIAPGRIADLVVFDPATIIDRATIEQPEAPPAGIPAVMVGGEWIVEEGKVTGRHPGRVLRPATGH
jgi:N-acyl-D-amino-acid deacylase